MKRRLAVLLILAALSSPPLCARVAGEMTVAAVTQTFVRQGTMATNRSISAYYHAVKEAPEGASATLEVPAALGVGTAVPIQITNITPGAESPDEPEIVGFWGSGDTIPANQPRIRKAHSDHPPRFTTGSTGMADPTRVAAIPSTAASSGTYLARVSYVGEASIFLTDLQNFLDPLVVTQPADGTVDFSGPIVIGWNPVGRAAGYRVTATARPADGRVIVWENALNSHRWRTHGVTAALRAHTLLPAEETSCTIPAGVFSSGPVLLRITALSPQAIGKGALKVVGWAQSTTTLELDAR